MGLQNVQACRQALGKMMVSGELFLQIARYEGILWSIADVFLVYAALKFVDTIRKYNGLKPYSKLYYLLIFSFLLTPLLLFVPNFWNYLVVEVVVLNIQYFILIYIMLMNYKMVFKTFEQKIF